MSLSRTSFIRARSDPPGDERASVLDSADERRGSSGGAREGDQYASACDKINVTSLEGERGKARRGLTRVL